MGISHLLTYPPPHWEKSRAGVTIPLYREMSQRGRVPGQGLNTVSRELGPGLSSWPQAGKEPSWQRGCQPWRLQTCTVADPRGAEGGIGKPWGWAGGVRPQGTSCYCTCYSKKSLTDLPSFSAMSQFGRQIIFTPTKSA